MSAGDLQELADRVKKELVQMRSARDAPPAKVLALRKLAAWIVATTDSPAFSNRVPIDAARADAHLAVTGLAMTIEQSPDSPSNILWGKATDAVERWRRSLD
jgi:hypothetical protein